jgi:hypothetical protein
MQYEQESAAVVPADVSKAQIASEYKIVRTRLAVIGSEAALRIVGLTSLAEIEDALMAAVTEALASLSEDAGGDGAPA